MRKPRIAFFIDQWSPGSGTENQLQGLLSNMVPTYIDAQLFTLRVPLEPEYRELFPCPVDCLGINSLANIRSLFKLPEISARLRAGHFDIGMIYFVDSNLYLVPACRLAGIPAVVINRRDMGYWYEAGLLRKLNFVNRWATHFLVNAEAVKEQVIRHEHFSPGRIQVIPNGMWNWGTTDRGQERSESESLHQFDSSHPVVGITAGLREVKRIDRFLEMAAQVSRKVPEARFVIAGQGHLQEALQTQARELGISDVVLFLGQVRDVVSLLNNFQVGVLTSESEGLSNSLVEYGLAGVPTVAFAVGGNSEVVCQSKTGYLVPPWDTDALAERVIHLLANHRLRCDMGRAAREHCQKKFAPERVRDLTLEFFISLIERTGELNKQAG